MSFFEKMMTPFQQALRQTVGSFINLETADDEHTLAANDGSLITYFRIEGCRQIIGEEEYKFLVRGSTLKIGSRFDKPGHALQVFFVRDPQRVKDQLERMLRPSRITADNTGLELQDVMDERIRNLSSYLSYEECYFVLWTRPSALTKSELERATKDRPGKAKKWVNASFAQDPLAALDALRTRHKSYVASVQSGLDELGVKATLLDTHTALRAIRNNLFPSRANDDWKACLPGDPIPARAPMSTEDMSDILWPPLRDQLVAGDARVIEDSIVQIGDQLWAGSDMTLGPMDPSPFPMLLNRLFEAKVPYRISFMIEGGGIYGTQFRSFIASILGVTNALNKQVKYALEGLEAMSRNEPVVRMRISVATWAKKGEINVLKDRSSILMQALESWGYCQASDFTGDPLDCVMASAMGIHCAGTAPVAIAPMVDVMKLLPWQRPSSPFTDGPVILRSPDGKVWPYVTGSNMTTTWFDLIFAQPGAGKSVLMNALNLGTILTPGLTKLPYVAVIDIGPSSSGLISLIKEALPAHRQHEVAYYRLQMSSQYAINPFDTQLGCRYPLMDERSYLVELLTLLCTPPGQERPYDGIQQLAGFVVDEMFRWRDDKQANAESRPYLPRIDYDVDEAIRKHNIHLPVDPYWWDVVDKLFDLGLYYEAGLAQRHAVPMLADAITASRRPQIRTLMEETSIGGSSETVINAFERMITSAIREYPILASVTQFEIRDARICSLDLMDVSPQGDDTADRQTAIMYMLARHALVRSWWVGMEALRSIPEKYRNYHEMRIQDLAETPKRLCYDEFHRTSASPAVRGQVIRDVREGRKRGVQIVLASQLLDDFDNDMIDLATGVWILGTAISDKAVDNVQARFGLSQTARNVIRYRLTGPRSSGAPALFVLGSVEGRYEQHLINTMGPIELWALSTSSEDVAIRNRLYGRLGAKRARQMLAMYFPGGSARTELKRRVMARAEAGEGREAAVGLVIEELVEELVAASIKATELAAASQNT
ncbi:MAG: type IV secretion protein IcmB [Pseudomonadota bacterium]